MIKDIKNAVIISPHPDDETLGVGGTIKKFSKNGINVGISCKWSPCRHCMIQVLFN